MKNYMHHITEESFGKLNVKIFNGKPDEVERRLSSFLESEPIDIDKITQSESADTDSFGITVTIFYRTNNPARFIRRDVTARMVHDDLMEHIEAEYGISFDAIMDIAFAKNGGV